MNMHTHANTVKESNRGFTLVELLVAIAVLLVVVLATSRIFGTASAVTGLGQASASVMQEAAALERRLREDIANLSHEGFFAIRQVAVPNDINVADGGPLLNPFLPNDATIRADQLVFFTTALESPQNIGISSGDNDLVRGQATVSRVYYGHGVQLPSALPADYVSTGVNEAHDPGIVNVYPTNSLAHLFDLRPWKFGPQQMVRTKIGSTGAGNVYQRSSSDVIDGTQPDALNWLLCRQSVVLVDDDDSFGDDDSKTVYMGAGSDPGIRTARSIFIDHPGYGDTREIRNGRVDGAATRLDDIRTFVKWNPDDNSGPRPWNDPTYGGGVRDQRSIIASSIYYPRAERQAPSARRVDQALTNHVINSAVSSFIVEWTWGEGTGEVLDDKGNLVPTGVTFNGIDDYFYGFRPNCWNFESDQWCQGNGDYGQPEQPWFGLNHPTRGVGFMGFDDAAVNDMGGLHYWERANFWAPISVWWQRSLDNAENNIERYFGPNDDAPFNPYNTGDEVRIYEAFFGYNKDKPLDRYGNAEFDLGYTPWPTAIRVTVVLHDTAGRLEHGREFQFVIDLPRRAH